MEKLKFETTINAPREKVWSALWDDASYREWTSAFMEGSHVETDNWKEGTKILFLSPSKDGMVSRVAANRKNEFMSFEHLGEVRNGVEDTTSDAVKQWAGALESYTLTDTNGKTHLLVELDISSEGEFKDYFIKTWPKALENLKKIAER